MATFMYYALPPESGTEPIPAAAAAGSYGGYFPHQQIRSGGSADIHAVAATGASYMMPANNAMQYMVPPPGIAIPAPLPGQQQQHRHQHQQNQHQQVNGGVSEVLDYNLEVMTSFVVQNAYFLFGNEDLKSEYLDVFNKGVLSVLNATRLPSTTVYYALDYLSKYLIKLPNGIESIGGDSVNVIYQNLMIAFVLANKFNDDKTFTNKSWSQATGMHVDTINSYEREWLAVFKWKLFEDKFETYGAYREAYNTFEFEWKLQQQQKQQHNNQIKHTYSPPPLLSPSTGVPIMMAPALPAVATQQQRQQHQQQRPPQAQGQLVPGSRAPVLPQAGSLYIPSSPFSQQGLHTPIHMKTVTYSSPCYSDIRSNTYYQHCFTSPVSTASPMPTPHTYGNYYTHHYHTQGASVPSILPNSFWNLPFEKRHVGPIPSQHPPHLLSNGTNHQLNSAFQQYPSYYQQMNQPPPNYYCYSTVY